MTYCNAELDALNEVVEDLRDAGAELIAVSPVEPEHSRRLIDRHGLDFPILFDEGNEVARRYGLVHELPEEMREIYLGFGVDLAECNGEAGWTPPMPARYVIDGDRRVRYTEVHPDYTRRPEPDDTLEFVRRLIDED